MRRSMHNKVHESETDFLFVAIIKEYIAKRVQDQRDTIVEAVKTHQVSERRRCPILFEQASEIARIQEVTVNLMAVDARNEIVIAEQQQKINELNVVQTV